jgi:hypothetical protein
MPLTQQWLQDPLQCCENRPRKNNDSHSIVATRPIITSGPPSSIHVPHRAIPPALNALLSINSCLTVVRTYTFPSDGITLGLNKKWRADLPTTLVGALVKAYAKVGGGPEVKPTGFPIGHVVTHV